MLGSRNSIRFPHKVTIALIALVLTATACGGANDNSADSSRATPPTLMLSSR